MPPSNDTQLIFFSNGTIRRFSGCAPPPDGIAPSVPRFVNCLIGTDRRQPADAFAAFPLRPAHRLRQATRLRISGSAQTNARQRLSDPAPAIGKRRGRLSRNFRRKSSLLPIYAPCEKNHIDERIACDARSPDGGLAPPFSSARSS